MTNTNPRTTRQTTTTGRPAWVGEGSVRQEGDLPLYRCNTCGADVVWATSARTGRRYLADVFPGHNRKHYVKASAHDCRTAERAAAAAVEEALAAYTAARAAFSADRKADRLGDVNARLAELDELAAAVTAAQDAAGAR